MVAMVVELNGEFNAWYFGCLSVRVFDTKADQWYSSVRRLDKLHNIASMRAGDGGLVCTVPTEIHKYKCDLDVTVSNPLTGAQILLPPYHATCTLPPRMVQLVMDADNKHYKVILVGELDHVAHIYWSKTGVWSSAESFPACLIFGSLFRWWADPEQRCFELNNAVHFVNNPMHRGISTVHQGAGVYDCVGRQLHEFDIVKGNPGLREFDIKSNPLRKIYVQSYALLKDHLIVLYIVHDHMTGYQLDLLEYQYQAQNGQPNWVKLRSHECGDISSSFLLQHLRDYNLKLYACSGFLLLKPSTQEKSALKPMLSWLYSLSTSK